MTVYFLLDFILELELKLELFYQICAYVYGHKNGWLCKRKQFLAVQQTLAVQCYFVLSCNTNKQIRQQIANLSNNILVQDLNICRGVHKSTVTWAGFL